MAATVTNLKVEHERGMLTTEIIISRHPERMLFLDGEAHANDLPDDMAEALLRWVLTRKDQQARRAALFQMDVLP